VIELNEALRGMAPLLERLLGPGIELELALTRSGAHPARGRAWDQVILNLAVNARDAMQGRGRLRIATSRRESDLAVVEVADDGRASRRRCCRASSTPSSPPGSTVAAPARAGQCAGDRRPRRRRDRGGEHPARGATFRLVLPGLAWSNGPVLFVDDEPGLLRLAGLALADEAGLLTAPDAESALDLLRDGCRPALLATDVTLPGMDALPWRGRRATSCPGSRSC
jgi:hypothetical protein